MRIGREREREREGCALLVLDMCRIAEEGRIIHFYQYSAYSASNNVDTGREVERRRFLVLTVGYVLRTYKEVVVACYTLCRSNGNKSWVVYRSTFARYEADAWQIVEGR